MTAPPRCRSTVLCCCFIIMISLTQGASAALNGQGRKKHEARASRCFPPSQRVSPRVELTHKRHHPHCYKTSKPDTMTLVPGGLVFFARCRDRRRNFACGTRGQCPPFRNALRPTLFTGMRGTLKEDTFKEEQKERADIKTEILRSGRKSHDRFHQGGGVARPAEAVVRWGGTGAVTRRRSTHVRGPHDAPARGGADYQGGIRRGELSALQALLRGSAAATLSLIDSTMN